MTQPSVSKHWRK